MFLACDGIRILASFLGLYYEENQDLIMLSIDSFHLFWKNILLPIEDLTLILAKYEVPAKIVGVMKKLVAEPMSNEAAAKFLDKTFFLLSCFANGPNKVKECLCEDDVVLVLFEIIEDY